MAQGGTSNSRQIFSSCVPKAQCHPHTLLLLRPARSLADHNQPCRLRQLRCLAARLAQAAVEGVVMVVTTACPSISLTGFQILLFVCSVCSSPITRPNLPFSALPRGHLLTPIRMVSHEPIDEPEKVNFTITVIQLR